MEFLDRAFTVGQEGNTGRLKNALKLRVLTPPGTACASVDQTIHGDLRRNVVQLKSRAVDGTSEPG